MFGISTEELLTGKNPEEKVLEDNISETEQPEEKPMTKEEARRKSAEVVSTSVFLYILSVVFIMIAIPVQRMNPIVASAIFLFIIAIATTRIIKHYMSIPKFEKTREEKREDDIVKQINSIIGAIFTAIYFIVSFMTFAWHVTWIIFVICGAVCNIVKLIFMLKEEKANEE